MQTGKDCVLHLLSATSPDGTIFNPPGSLESSGLNVDLLSPLSPIVSELPDFGQFFNWCCLSCPDVALQTSVTVDNPVCMNDETEYVTPVFFCLKCLFAVNIHKKKLSCSLITKTKLNTDLGLWTSHTIM